MTVRLPFLAALTGAALLLPASSSGAVTVGTEAQLRAAFADAGQNSISLSGNITLSNCAAAAGDLDRSSATALTLHGNGHTIAQNCPDRVVEQSGAGKLTLDEVTITGGEAQNGGGIYVDSNRTAEITDSTVEGNDAFTGGGGMVVDTERWSPSAARPSRATMRSGPSEAPSPTSARCSCTTR